MDRVPVDKEFTEAIEEIIGYLRKRGYERITGLPYVKGNIFSVVNDIKFFVGKNGGLFKSSFLYALRRRVFGNMALVALFDFFILNRKIEYSKISAALGEDIVRKSLNLGILSEGYDKSGNRLLESGVRIVPFDGEYFICDPSDRAIPDFVWIGSDSLLLAERLRNLDWEGRLAVDIGSGTGIQAIALSARPGARVIAVDINEKGLRYGKLNSMINKKSNINFVRSDMFSAIRGGIDIIVSNPPFVFLPPEQKMANRDGYGGDLGLEKIIYMLEKLPEYLNPAGTAVILTLSPVVRGRDILLERVRKILSKNYVIDYEIVDLAYINRYKSLYEAEGISYFIQGILKITKDELLSVSRISIKDMPKARKLVSFIKVAFKRSFNKDHVHAS